jgi:hypothetical protein
MRHAFTRDDPTGGRNPGGGLPRRVSVARSIRGFRMKWSLSAVSALLVIAATARADDEKPAGPIALTVVAKTDKYKFDGGGKTADEYKKELEATAKALAGGERPALPEPPAVDLALRLTNTSKEDITVYVGGTVNVYTLELSGGAGVVTMKNTGPMPAFRVLPQAVTLGPGKSHEIPVASLSDGLRGRGRFVFWSGPGEYKLSAKYLLSDAAGGKGVELTSGPTKITVTDK